MYIVVGVVGLVEPGKKSKSAGVPRPKANARTAMDTAPIQPPPHRRSLKSEDGAESPLLEGHFDGSPTFVLVARFVMA
jgi:hypothetical protein